MTHLEAVRRPMLDIVLAALLLTATAALAAAQTSVAERPAQPGRISVFVSAGGNTQTDDESQLGTGIGLGGGIGYRLTEKWSVEGAVAHLRHSRDLTYSTVSTDPLGHLVASPYHATLDGGATYVLAQLHHRFSTSRVQPHIAFGAGVMHYSGDSWGSVMPPIAGTPIPAARTVKTATAGSISGGVDIAAGSTVSVGPFVNLLLSNPGETGTSMALFTGIAIAVRR